MTAALHSTRPSVIPPPSSYTLGNLLDCANREAEVRRRVYANLVAKGRMKQSVADWEIGAMDAIAALLTARIAEIAAKRLTHDTPAASS